MVSSTLFFVHMHVQSLHTKQSDHSKAFIENNDFLQELDITHEKIEFNDALVELSEGSWEGRPRSHIYTPELLNIIANCRSDFCPPDGESQRQVEFRMIEFLNKSILPRALAAHLHKTTRKATHKSTSRASQAPTVTSGISDRNNGSSARNQNRKPLAVSHSNGRGRRHSWMASKDSSMDSEECSSNEEVPYYVALFSHEIAIKCLLQGILGSNPHLTHYGLCIDNTSMTVLRHSTYHGWQIHRMNDTSHLRLL